MTLTPIKCLEQHLAHSNKHGVPESIVCGLWRARGTSANVLCSLQAVKSLRNRRKPSQAHPEGATAALMGTSATTPRRGERWEPQLAGLALESHTRDSNHVWPSVSSSEISHRLLHCLEFQFPYLPALKSGCKLSMSVTNQLQESPRSQT